MSCIFQVHDNVDCFCFLLWRCNGILCFLTITFMLLINNCVSGGSFFSTASLLSSRESSPHLINIHPHPESIKWCKQRSFCWPHILLSLHLTSHPLSGHCALTVLQGSPAHSLPLKLIYVACSKRFHICVWPYVWKTYVWTQKMCDLLS